MENISASEAKEIIFKMKYLTQKPSISLAFDTIIFLRSVYNGSDIELYKFYKSVLEFSTLESSSSIISFGAVDKKYIYGINIYLSPFFYVIEIISIANNVKQRFELVLNSSETNPLLNSLIKGNIYNSLNSILNCIEKSESEVNISHIE